MLGRFNAVTSENQVLLAETFDKVLRIQSQVRKREQRIIHIVVDPNAKRREKMVNAKYIYIYLYYFMFLLRI